MAARSPRMSLSVQYAVAGSGLPPAPRLRRWAKAAQERDCIVTVRFVGKREGQTLNALYRGKEYATNVLAFLYDASATIEGDIVLCAPVVREEARAQGKTLTDATAGAMMNACVKTIENKVQMLQSLAPPPAATKKPEGR